MLPTRQGSNLQPPDHQLDMHPTQTLKTAISEKKMFKDYMILYMYIAQQHVR